jgi:ribonuclease HI
MQCFFYGTTRQEDSIGGHNGVVSFSIPDLGIVFRAQFTGNPVECEYASLLALLEFIEINPHLFQNRTVEIFGDSFEVVNQVNLQMICQKDLEPYRNMALVYKKKIPYSLNWIPEKENPAQSELVIR